MNEHGQYTSDEIKGYDFEGAAAAPEGFNPEARGFVDPVPGIHVMEFDFEGSTMKENHEFSVKEDGTTNKYTLNQLWAKLRIVEGPHAGANVLDFVPMPTPGKAMPAKLANRWGNFIRAFGFQPPPGRVVPAGFSLAAMDKRRAQVELEAQTEGDGKDRKPKLDDRGKPRIGVRYFGYNPLSLLGPAAAGAATAAVPTPDIDL